MDHERGEDLIGVSERIHYARKLDDDCDRRYAEPCHQTARSDRMGSSLLAAPYSHFPTAVYKIQNVNNKEKLETAFFGIVSVQR